MMTRAAAHLSTQPVLSVQIHITSENELFFSLEVFFFLSVRVKHKSNRVSCLISREGWLFYRSKFYINASLFSSFFRGLCVWAVCGKSILLIWQVIEYYEHNLDPLARHSARSVPGFDVISQVIYFLPFFTLFLFPSFVCYFLLSVFLSVSKLVCLSASLFVRLSVCQSVNLIHSSIGLSIC